MKIKTALVSSLAVATALVSFNANASSNDPATAYHDYYKMSAEQKAKATANTEVKTVEVNGKSIQASVRTSESGIVDIALDSPANFTYYTVGNLIVKAPADMLLTDINASLKALGYEQQVSNVGYLMNQVQINKKS
ncbi:hypothetical protein CKF54_07750 [Psittacicella hinzii]|uniref:Uncharacterized protein n=1 Tax=Psittacicella hinzii TaxID=2028575 RepID=A0A3A1Y4K7_9GAMM|nr:hypothetical protein [Psittacicella hinzii]RIY31087.1 hypothetical protein CKF54_07750 [Psittacicella hinzii]